MNVYDFTAKRIDGAQQSLADYEGKLLLIVNTASNCGFTPQYEGLEKLYRQYRAQGFEVLGFPCNQFMKQEQGNDSDIQQFCQLNYGVTFPTFAKINVNGSEAHPLYKFLKRQTGIWPFNVIKWNFTKFLIDRKGRVVNRYLPTTKPEELNPAIENLLKNS